MAQTGMLLLLLACFVTSALLIDVTKLKVYPKNGSMSGVFHAWLSSSYAFNASVARDVCNQLGVTIADKAQLERAHAHGFETCKFGWIDEKVAVIPRIHSKDSCGQGRVGIIPWRTTLSSKFDVFCFNVTDYEAHVNTEHVNPSTTVTPTAHTSAEHPKLAKTTRSGFQDDLLSTSSSLSESMPVNDSPEPQTFSNTSPTATVGLIALLTTVLAFLLLGVAAVCYFKRNNMGWWTKPPQKESIETEIWGNNQQKPTTNDVCVTVKPENENGAPS